MGVQRGSLLLYASKPHVNILYIIIALGNFKVSVTNKVRKEQIKSAKLCVRYIKKSSIRMRAGEKAIRVDS
jgi:hypothetical protein